MIQDIFPSVFENHFENFSPSLDDRICLFQDGKILARHDKTSNDVVYPLRREFSEEKQISSTEPLTGAFRNSEDSASTYHASFSSIYIFTLNGEKYFLVLPDSSAPTTAPLAGATQSNTPASANPSVTVPSSNAYANTASSSNTPASMSPSSNTPDSSAQATTTLIIPEGYTFYSLHAMRELGLSSNTGIFAAYSAFHLDKWYRANRFSGCCGTKTEPDTVERALVCPSCGSKTYPRINPAVIVGVKNGDRILLTKYKSGFAHNALVAGFVEFGETLEQTVRREVMEEAGIHVKNIRYYKSQPWGIALDLLAGFYCEVDGDDTIRMDRSELKYAEWVRREDIILQPSDHSLTNEMMKRFKEGKEA